MRDGLWRVELRDICAGFVVEGGRVTRCAPILRRSFRAFAYYATWVCP